MLGGKFWLVVILVTITTVKAQTCLHTNNGAELRMYFRDYRYSTVEDDTIPRGHQAIIPSYKFVCSGFITEWAVDVHRGGGANSGYYTLDLQVWRPSPTDQGCYSLVGNNRFTSVRLEITQVAKVTPLPQDCCIEVQPDDVLGFFVDNPNNEKNGVVAIDEINNDPIMYSRDEVWYGNVQGYTPSDTECPYPIGTHTNAILNTLRMAAPVISLAMTDVCCLPETTGSSTSNPGTSTSDNDSTNQPTDSQTIYSSSQSNRVTTPQASAIADDATSTIFTESQASPSKGAPLVAALTGGSVGAVLLILVVVIAVASFAVCMRSGKCHKKANLPSRSPDDDDLSTNYNYGISMHPVAKCRYSLENMYDTPNTVFSAVEKLETKRNEAYNVILATVDEVTKPVQECNSFEYDYVQ